MGRVKFLKLSSVRSYGGSLKNIVISRMTAGDEGGLQHDYHDSLLPDSLKFRA